MAEYTKHKLGFNWPMREPYIFCAHHRDAYPRGNRLLGPAASMDTHRSGEDFGNPEGWNMYYGDDVPGFPVHPHRGFETVTIVLDGYVDHADSMGAAGRYGMGDVQWMTAGQGCQHAEMFPLLDPDRDNPLELFQVWLNLPARSKFVEPSYRMLWAEDIPRLEIVSDGGALSSRIRLIAGHFAGKDALPPTPDSWAADPANGVQILLAEMDPGAQLVLPAGSRTSQRTLYFYRGSTLRVDGQHLTSGNSIELPPERDVELLSVDSDNFFLLLAAEPIGEPIARYGPFVMNTREEIAQAYRDYERTRFGGWPWDRPDPVHGSHKKRFARYVDGTQEERPAR